MKTMPTFTFHQFSLRPCVFGDLGLATWWTSQDPAHATTTDPKFWIEQTLKDNSFILEDRVGEIFFFKMSLTDTPKEIEIHIQFAPHDEVSRQRVMHGLIHGFEWLQKELSQIGFETIYFNSMDRGLIHFCGRRLGFNWDGRRLIRRINDGKTQSRRTQPATRQRLCGTGTEIPSQRPQPRPQRTSPSVPIRHSQGESPSESQG